MDYTLSIIAQDQCNTNCENDWSKNLPETIHVFCTLIIVILRWNANTELEKLWLILVIKFKIHLPSTLSENLTFRGPCIIIYSYNKTNKMQ